MIALSDTIQLQGITLDDHQKLLMLVRKIYPQAYKHLWKNEDCSYYYNTFFSLQNLEKELTETESEYYFVNHNGANVGIFRIQFNKPPVNHASDTHSSYLHRIYLDSNVHGKGVAQKLMTWFEIRAKQENNTSIWLKAMDTQQQALRFYEKQGFEKIGITALNFIQLHDHTRGMIIMNKVLD